MQKSQRTILRRRNLWLASGLLGVLSALVFFWWSIQTAWLGSFPGRDIASYARWAYAQMGMFILSVVFAVVAFVKCAKTPR